MRFQTSKLKPCPTRKECLGVVKALEEFKLSVYGENYNEENDNPKAAEASKKRKAVAELAAKEGANYDWGELADNGKLKDLTVAELKEYLTAHNLPVAQKKEALISRILTHTWGKDEFGFCIFRVKIRDWYSEKNVRFHIVAEEGEKQIT